MRWNVALTCVLVALSLADCGSRAESSEWSWGKGRDRSTDGKATGKVIKSLTDSQNGTALFQTMILSYPFNKFPALFGTRRFITAHTTATGQYPESGESNPYPETLSFYDPF
jgi:hypothetical protein